MNGLRRPGSPDFALLPASLNPKIRELLRRSLEKNPNPISLIEPADESQI